MTPPLHTQLVSFLTWEIFVMEWQHPPNWSWEMLKLGKILRRNDPLQNHFNFEGSPKYLELRPVFGGEAEPVVAANKRIMDNEETTTKEKLKKGVALHQAAYPSKN